MELELIRTPILRAESAAVPVSRLLAVLALALCSAAVFAQGIQLSSEQQQMLNQLPPAQRQQAMDAIRQLQAQQSTAAQQSINETAPQRADTASSGIVEPALTELDSRAEAGSRLVLTFGQSEDIDGAMLMAFRQDAVLQKLVGSQFYVLDDTGALSLQGLEPIPLLGLDEADIKRRPEAEPYLSVFDIDARILGQTLVGVEAL